MDRIKSLYHDANVLHKQAMDILNANEGKEMPAEVSAQVDVLLNDVESKTAEAKRLERAATLGGTLGEPVNPLPTPQAPTSTNIKERGNEEYKAAYNAFLRKGIPGMTSAEVKALSAGDDQAGGYITVPDQHRNEVLRKQREVSAMRAISRVLPAIAGGSSITPTEESDLSNAEWTTEIKTGSADTVKPFGRRILTPHPLGKQIRVSRTLLRSAMFNVDAWVNDRLAEQFAIPEENAFINGTGASQPLGLLNTSGLPLWTTAGSLAVTGDDVINWVYSLPARYAPGARILCNRAFIRKVRLLKGTDNNYLWQPGLQGGSPSAILDVPYTFSDRMDDGLDTNDAWEANAKIAVIGDFSYFWIVDSLNLTIQRVDELYAATNEVGYIGRKEADGMAVLAEAFYGLRVKA